MSSKTEIIIDGQNRGAIVAINGVKTELSSLGPAGNKISSMMSQIFNPTTLAIGAVTGLATIMKQAINTADELYMMSQRIGVSVESLSVLKYAAEQSDLSLEQMQVGLKKLSTNLYDVSIGAGKDAALTFNELGISIFGANGKVKQADQALLEIADRFAQMTDGTEKSALAVKLFGKSGLELIPFLNEGKAGISQLTDEAERLGLKLSTETGAAAEQFNDDLQKIAASLQGISYKLLPGLASELELLSYTIEHGTWWEFLTFQDEYIQQQIELEKHTKEVNKVFYETFGIQNQIYPLMVDQTNNHNASLNTQLNTIRQLNDEYAKLVQTQAAGQPQSKAVGANGQYPSFSELPSAGYEMFPVDVNPFDPLQNNAVDFFDFTNDESEKLREATANMFGSMSGAMSAFYNASGQKAKAFFVLHKSMAIAEATINTFNGASKALAQGGIFGFIGAATIIAAGMGYVANIASQNPSSSSGGGSGYSSGGSSVGAQSVNNNQGTGNYSAGQNVTYNYNFNAPVMDHDKFARDILPSLNKASSDGVS